MGDIINANMIISCASLITALGIIFGCIKAYFKQTDKWNGYDEQIKGIEDQIQGLRDEQLMQTHVLWATLDGLHQLGCNGDVTNRIIKPTIKYKGLLMGKLQKQAMNLKNI